MKYSFYKWKFVNAITKNFYTEFKSIRAIFDDINSVYIQFDLNGMEKFKEFEVYTPWQLLNDLGGVFGITFGHSFLSLCNRVINHIFK